MQSVPYKININTQRENPLTSLMRSLIASTGEDANREGLQRTPERFLKAFRELTSGYNTTPEAVVGEGIFSSESSGIVCVKDIEFFSLCEHHLLPFWGKASIAYIPQEKILGLSKLARILDVFAKRLQVQERLTKEVADSILNMIDAKAVVVKIEAQHMCMMMRGVEKQSSATSTEYLAEKTSLSEAEKARLWKQIEG